MFTKRSTLGRLQSVILVLVISLFLPLNTGLMARSTLAASDEPPFQGEPKTAFQSELAAALSQRQAVGLPIPDVTFNTKTADIRRSSAPLLPQMQALAGETTTIATTDIYFDGPQEAGFDEWPALNIKGDLADNDINSFETGDLNEVIHAAVEEQIPGFWQQVEFGQEARKFRITETSELSPASDESRLVTSSLDDPQLSTDKHLYLPLPNNKQASPLFSVADEDILMGFTYTGPHIDYTIEYEAKVCLPDWLGGGCADLFYLKAGFELDWALGLRLPASVTLNGPDQVEQGSDAYFETRLIPQNWDSSDYGNYGVAEESGNEFVLRFSFFAGIKLEVLGEDMCPSGFTCYVEFDEDGSKSFITPFGTDSSFPIPSIDIKIFELNIVGLFNFSTSLTITPLLSSTKIMADWNAVPGSDCSGSGTITYTEPDTPVTFGPISVCNLDQNPETNQAQVELDNFRYYFNSFQIQLGAKVAVDVFGVYQKTVEGAIFTLDLSKIFSGLGLYVGDHVQCTYDFSCSEVGPDNSLIMSSTTIDKTPPVTIIMLNGDLGSNGWYLSDVKFSLNSEDYCGSGVELIEYSFDNSSWISYSGEVTLTDEGINTIYYRSQDFDANLEMTKSQIIQIDKNPPVITGAPTTAPNSFGWWNTDVTIHFKATDATSGIDYVTPDVTISSEGANQSVTGTAVDFAGNQAQVTVNFINIDKTPPFVAIDNPQSQYYMNTDSFNITWTALDSLSGINIENGELDGAAVNNEQLVELRLVAAGEHTIMVTAFDKADNFTSVSRDFFVTVDIDGLIASVEYMCDEGWIVTPGICNSYLAKLNNAKNAINRGQCKVGENILNAFIHEVKALSGKKLTEEAANVSNINTLYVIDNLGCASTKP